MKKVRYFFCKIMKSRSFIGVVVSGWFLFATVCQTGRAASSDIILSEVSIAGVAANDEFIELYNNGSVGIDLTGMQLRRRTASGSESSIRVFAKNSIIPAQGYFLWANSQGLFKGPLADSETDSSALAPDNSIGLFTKSGADGILLDSLTWGKGSSFTPTAPTVSNPAPKKSLTRERATLEWSLTDSPTPTNSRGETWTPPPVLPPPPATPSFVRFNELLPDPIGNENTEEFIEFWNEDQVSADISGFIVHDASKTGSYTFPAGTLIAGQSYFVLTRNISKLSLNNTDETLTLSDASSHRLDTVAYDQAKPGVSLNYTPAGWRGGTPTPGLENHLNTLPETRERVPKKGYRGVPFSLNARGSDADGGNLKFTWDFGDGHKSYKPETTHTYEEKGRYQITLTTTDGQDDLVEHFSIQIDPLPKPHVRITALAPNPAGSDAENEWLTIENRDKKPVDLKGYGIATGWKKLTNHPIRERFVIAPGAEVKLTRVLSRFTLPNEKGRIEFRTPDGKVLQKIQYKLSKAVAEGVIYSKEKGRAWTWEKDEEIPVPEQVKDSAETPVENPELKPILPENDGTKQVLGAETVTEKMPLELPLLLNYGTRVKLPADIHLRFAGLSTSDTPAAETDLFRLDSLSDFFPSLNATLNDWQNRTE